MYLRKIYFGFAANPVYLLHSQANLVLESARIHWSSSSFIPPLPTEISLEVLSSPIIKLLILLLA